MDSELVELEPVAEMIDRWPDTLERLALATGVHRDTLSRIRSRRRRFVTFNVADCVALVFDQHPPEPVLRGPKGADARA